MLFKTHAPHNRIVGGGFLSGFVTLRVSEAWRFFGEGNGSATEAQVLEDGNGYRKGQGKAWDPDLVIGCILLRNIFFAPSGDDLPAPPEFSRGGSQRYKRYDLTEPTNDHIASALGQLETTARPDLVWPDDLQLDVAGPVVGIPRLTTPGVGQSAFKALVLGASAPLRDYRITDRAGAGGGPHQTCQGWRHPPSRQRHAATQRRTQAVRRWIPRRRRPLPRRVSPRLKSEFGNGVEFDERERVGHTISVPETANYDPNAKP
jgi:putative restriction endonuclease